MSPDFSSSVLGETAGTHRVDGAEDNRAATLAMIRQCTRLLDIASRQLDPIIYDNAEVLEAVKALALRSRYTEIRIVVLDPGPVLARGHRLIELARALSSFMQIRVPGEDHRDFNEALLIADRTGYIHRQMADRFAGSVDFHDPRTAADLLRRFDALWDTGEPDPNFRRLHL